MDTQKTDLTKLDIAIEEADKCLEFIKDVKMRMEEVNSRLKDYFYSSTNIIPVSYKMAEDHLRAEDTNKQAADENDGEEDNNK
jgi:hypothetical protein